MDTWWLFYKINIFLVLFFKTLRYKILENGAVESGDQYLGKHGWEKGKHL
jgi:hypothetical protein